LIGGDSLADFIVAASIRIASAARRAACVNGSSSKVLTGFLLTSALLVVGLLKKRLN